MRGPDDGLFARPLWTWPDPVPFQLSRQAPGAQFAINALDRLRELDLQQGDRLSPMMVPLTDEGREMIAAFGRERRQRQARAGGLRSSAIGKARRQALRLGLGLEPLCWGGQDGMPPPQLQIGMGALD